MDKVPMTVQGAQSLRDELAQLKTVDRPNVVKAIAEARAHGDLKENAEYHAAKEQQGFIEARITDIESKLSLAHIIDITQIKASDKVIFGSTVTLFNVEDESEITYKIVGEDEANIKENKISNISPIARALMGKHLDDVVKINIPAGTVEYEIIAVEYV